jgi:hypothetical protein
MSTLVVVSTVHGPHSRLDDHGLRFCRERLSFVHVSQRFSCLFFFTPGEENEEGGASNTSKVKAQNPIEDATLNDVVVTSEATNPSKTKGRDADLTKLKSIMGVPTKELNMMDLNKFCTKNQIQSVRNKPKKYVCDAIVRIKVPTSSLVLSFVTVTFIVLLSHQLHLSSCICIYYRASKKLRQLVYLSSTLWRLGLLLVYSTGRMNTFRLLNVLMYDTIRVQLADHGAPLTKAQAT